MPSISSYVKSFETYARNIDGRSLKQGLWMGFNSACALGAFFQITEIGEAWRKAIDAGLNNAKWLIGSTPHIFDSMINTDAIEWAQAIYGEGGIMHRSEKLEQSDRDTLFEEARREVAKRLICNGYAADLHTAFASQIGHREAQKRIAATAVQVLDELLTTKEIQALFEDGK